MPAEAKKKRAMQLFKRAVRLDEHFIEAHLKLSELYEGNDGETERIRHLEAAVRIAPDHPLVAPAYARLGTIYYRSGDYKKAQPLLAHAAAGADEVHALSAQRALQNIAFALQAIEEPVDFQPMLLPFPLNQHPMQYFPSLNATQDKMIFTIRKGHHTDDDEDIYISEKDPVSGVWGVPRSLSPHVNTKNYNEGSSIISADGLLIVFTSCQRPDGKGSCDLYLSECKDAHWQWPQHLPEPVNSPHWESQPSLSVDKRTLYFVSNRPGGVGKRDIWFTRQRPDGTWRVPQNIGAAINTPEDDIAPFVPPHGAAIYFSSNGHVGMGGYDLYVSEKDAQGKWGTPKNLGFPINNHKDEVSLFVDAEGAHGYYTDERLLSEGVYESLLYKFFLTKENRLGEGTRAISGTVRSAEDQSPLVADVSIVCVEEDGRLVWERRVISSDTGHYEMVVPDPANYRVQAEKPGYKSRSISVVAGAQTIDILLHPIRPVPPREAALPTSVIFFALDSHTVRAEYLDAIATVASFLAHNTDFSLAIEGHTDDSGTVPRNKRLSVARARAVYRLLLQEGVDGGRLTYKGFGSERPTAPNNSKANRRKNRRVSFRLEERRCSVKWKIGFLVGRERFFASRRDAVFS